MTDQEEWEQLLLKYNIKFFKEKREDDEHTYIETDEGEGYLGFTFSLKFNCNGKFISYGVWE